MKKMKSMIAMIMALIMILGMSATAFAATKDTATITVKDNESTTTAAQLTYVQVIAPDPTTLTGWAFVNGAGEYYVKAFEAKDIKDADDNVLASAEQVAIAMLIKATTPTDELADELENTPEEIAKLPSALKDVAAAGAAQMDDALSQVGAKCTFSDDEVSANVINVDAAGVYAIKASELGYTYKTMAAYVGFGVVDNNEYPSLLDATVITKKSPTSITKTVSDADAATQIDDTVTYVITAYVPYIDVNATDKTFKITDQIDGAEYDFDSITAYMEGDDTNYATDETVDENIVVPTGYDDAFEIDLKDLVDATNSNANKLITVTYQAKITEVETHNTATAHISDTVSSGDSEELYTGNITLTKTNEDGSVALKDAEFTLTVSGSDTALTFVERQPSQEKDDQGNFIEDQKTRYYTYDAEGTVTTLVTGENGKLMVEGLNVGDYHFTETKAPKGYTINEDGVDATLTVTDKATDIFTQTAEIKDTKLLALPSTGGIGTTIFTIAGCGIMIAAAVFFFASRKKEEE